jgi:hypothetical protein
MQLMAENRDADPTVAAAAAAACLHACLQLHAVKQQQNIVQYPANT